MSKSKEVCSPLAGHLNLSLKQCHTSEKDVKEMSKVPYASAVGSLMYVMVCTRPDITHAVGVVSRFLTDLGKEHCVTPFIMETSTQDPSPMIGYSKVYSLAYS